MGADTMNLLDIEIICQNCNQFKTESEMKNEKICLNCYNQIYQGQEQ